MTIATVLRTMYTPTMINSLEDYDTASIRERLRVRSVIDKNGCWIFQGSPSNKTYCQLWVRNPGEPRILIHAHRVAYMAFKGEIPAGYTIDHLCEVGTCVNPEHLDAVTVQENIQRHKNNHPVTHCPQGHEYTPENTKYNLPSIKSCRKCINRGRRIRYHRDKTTTRPVGRPRKMDVNTGVCKIHATPLTIYGRCLQKGCKYA